MGGCHTVLIKVSAYATALVGAGNELEACSFPKRACSGLHPAPRRNRTSDLQLRRLSLYPAELRVLMGKHMTFVPVQLIINAKRLFVNRIRNTIEGKCIKGFELTNWQEYIIANFVTMPIDKALEGGV